jgi:hypothetical protein
MQYTVSSRGRPIGVTDLGFVRIGGPNRSGWFHPNAEGERLMPVIASVIPAMRAFLHRDVRGAEGEPIVQPHLLGSTLFADIAEALHHVGALELTLHHANGSVIPTRLVGIQDTEQLLALAQWDDALPETDAWAGGPTRDEEPDADFELAPDAWLTDIGTAPDDADSDEAWRPDEERPAFPRYQIHVALVDADAIP